MTHDQAEAFTRVLEEFVRQRIAHDRRRNRGEYEAYLAAGERAELARKQLVAMLVEPTPTPTPWCPICPHPEHSGPCGAFDVAFQPDNRCPCNRKG